MFEKKPGKLKILSTKQWEKYIAGLREEVGTGFTN